MIFFHLSSTASGGQEIGAEASPVIVESWTNSFGSEVYVGELTLGFFEIGPGPLDLLFFSLGEETSGVLSLG
jgi:hypothetical protein